MLQSTEIALKGLKGTDFFPPIDGELPSVRALATLTRRHVARLSTQDPHVEMYYVGPTLKDMGLNSNESDLSILRIQHSQQSLPGDFNPDLLQATGMTSEYFVLGSPRHGSVKEAQILVRAAAPLREKRATNGLDSESRDPASPWYLDLANLRLNAQSVVLLKRCTLMRAVFLNKALAIRKVPREAIRQVATEEVSRFEFSFPGFLQVLAFDLDQFYRPLRRYGHLSDTVGKPHLAPALIGRPPLIAKICKDLRYGDKDEGFPSEWPFVENGRPYCRYLVLLAARTGRTRRYILKNRESVARATKIVERLRERGARYVLRRFDADYIVACLPLGARNRLARLTKRFQDLVREEYDPDFDRKGFREIFEAWASGKRRPKTPNSKQDKSGNSDDSQDWDESTNLNPEESDSDDRDSDSDEIHLRIQVARNELVVGLEKISRLMVENCQAAADASAPILPVAYLTQTAWWGFFRRRLEQITPRRPLRRQVTSAAAHEDPVSRRIINKMTARLPALPDWACLLGQLQVEAQPEAWLRRFTARMPTGLRFTTDQVDLLCRILAVGYERGTARAQMDICSRKLPHLQAACEKSYAALLKLPLGLPADLKTTRERFDDYEKARDEELKLELTRCCRSLGLPPVDASTGKARPLTQRLIDIADNIAEGAAIRKRIAELWGKASNNFAESKLGSGLSREVGQFHSRKLWRLLKCPHPCLREDAQGVVLLILRTAWPHHPTTVLERMAEKMSYTSAHEIQEQFWACVRLLQQRDDIRQRRRDLIIPFIKQKNSLPGWREIPRLVAKILEIPDLRKYGDSSFVDDLLQRSKVKVPAEQKEEVRAGLRLLREWADCEEFFALADKKYFARSTQRSRLLKMINFPIRPLIKRLFPKQPAPEEPPAN